MIEMNGMGKIIIKQPNIIFSGPIFRDRESVKFASFLKVMNATKMEV